MGDESLEGSDDSDSDPSDTYTSSGIMTTDTSTSDSISNTAPYQIQIKYNSIYHNAGKI